jgi:VIT1/CCC1 family predicted Fe2+/Mn2+ transporter
MRIAFRHTIARLLHASPECSSAVVHPALAGSVARSDAQFEVRTLRPLVLALNDIGARSGWRAIYVYAIAAFAFAVARYVAAHAVGAEAGRAFVVVIALVGLRQALIKTT